MKGVKDTEVSENLNKSHSSSLLWSRSEKDTQYTSKFTWMVNSSVLRILVYFLKKFASA